MAMEGDDVSANTTLRQSAKSGVAWSFTQTLASRLLTALVFLVLARLLDPDDFGLVALASVVTALLTVLVEQGFVQALVQRPVLDDGHLDSAFWLSLVTGAACTVATVALAGPLSTLLGDEAVAPILRVLALSFLVPSLASVPRALLQRRLAFRSLAYSALVASVLGAVAGVTLAVLGGGAWALVAQTLTTLTVQGTGYARAAGWSPGREASRRHASELFGFSTRVAGSQILNYLSRRSDDFLIGVFLGATSLGFYAVAYRVLLIMTDVLVRTVATVALPIFARVAHDGQRHKRAVVEATRLTTVIAVPGFLLVSVTAPELVSVLFGERWTASAPVMRVLSLIGIVHAVFFVNSQALTAIGRPGTVLRLDIANTVVNVIAFAVAVRWGITAVAIGYVASGYLMVPARVVASKRHLGIGVRRYAAELAPALFAGATMVAVVAVLGSALTPALGAVGSLAILVPLGLLVYFLVLRLLAPSHLSELTAHLSRTRRS